MLGARVARLAFEREDQDSVLSLETAVYSSPVSLPLKFATFEFATNIPGSLPIGKVQNLHLWKGKRKRTRNILKYFIF